MPNIFIVIPTIRNLDFLKYWKSEFSDCSLIVVEDRNIKTVEIDNFKFSSVFRYCHQDIDKEFKKDSWIFSRRNAGIRNYGFWKAHQKGADIIITIDDDCYPVENNFVNKHLENLNYKSSDCWTNTYPNPEFLYTRGFPYLVRDKNPIMISHGLWSGSLDLDAKTEISTNRVINEKPYKNIRQVIPKGYYYPMCSMNLAFKKEITPLMFFPMMGYDITGEKWEYDRYDDIWAGIFSKKIIDHLNFGVVSGSPSVEHKRLSNVIENLAKEKKGINVNETLWKLVDQVKLSKSNPKDCYIELAKKINFPEGKYFEKLKEAMIIWANLF